MEEATAILLLIRPRPDHPALACFCPGQQLAFTRAYTGRRPRMENQDPVAFDFRRPR